MSWQVKVKYREKKLTLFFVIHVVQHSMLMPQHEHVSVVHIAPCTFISNFRKPKELKKIWLSAYPIYRILIWLSADPIYRICQSGCLQVYNAQVHIMFASLSHEHHM